MNHRQALIAASLIERLYLQSTFHKPEQAANGCGLSHLRWMVQKMHEDMAEDKAMRWLGYIQGTLVTTGLASLEEMKLISAEASKK